MSAEILTETLVRGIGPALSRSSTSRARPGPLGAGELDQRLVAARGVPVGLGLGHGRLAEQVDRAGHAAVPQVAEHAERRCRRLADDEPVRHVLHPGRGGGADRGPGGSVVGHPHRRGQRRRGVGDLAQELAQVPGEIVERPAGGRDVDEPEQRGLQLLVGRREIHRPLVERSERMPGARRERGREVRADLVDRALERLAIGGGEFGVGHRAQDRMLTARATTSPTVTNDTSDCAPISHFAVGVSGIVSVGLNAVAFVSETYR